MEKSLDHDTKDMTAIENYKVMVELSEQIFHDFKNILATISGLAQLSMVKTQSDEVRDYLSHINSATFEFRDTLDKYYNYTSGNSHSEDKPFNMVSIVNKALEMIKFRLNRTNATGSGIILDLRISSNATVMCDEHELKQSILNIMMNALDAMEDRGGTFTIKLTDNDDGSFVNLEISDTGIGIPNENLNRIFDSKFTTKAKGTGLGLKIVKICIERLGGSLSLKSKENVGTSVIISLPIFIDENM